MDQRSCVVPCHEDLVTTYTSCIQFNYILVSYVDRVTYDLRLTPTKLIKYYNNNSIGQYVLIYFVGSLLSAIMCGISLVVSHEEAHCEADSTDFPSVVLKNSLGKLLTARGPDVQNAVNFSIPAPLLADTALVDKNLEVGNPLHAWMFGSVLHIQGESITAQPCVDQHGNHLLWNGEVFGQDSSTGSASNKLTIGLGESDTTAVARMLAIAADSVTTSNQTLNYDDLCRAITTAITHCLSTIHGPYAFIYYHKDTNSIHFGRDPFGRRSLVLGYTCALIDSACADANKGVDFVVDAHNPFVLSSVCPPKVASIDVTDELCTESSTSTASDRASNRPTSDVLWEEVNITGVYCLHIKHVPTSTIGTTMNLSCVPWPLHRLRVGRGLHSVQDTRNGLTSSGREFDIGMLFRQTLQDAVERRVNSMPHADCSTTTVVTNETTTVDAITLSSDDRSRVGVLFSGGIDSVLLTALLHHCTSPELSIDLLNVTFIKTSGSSATSTATPSPDRVAAIAALLELQTIFPTREWRLVHIDVTEEERFAHEQHIMNLIRPSDTHMDLNIGTAFWFASRGRGYLRTYSTEELSELFSATTDNGTEGGEEDGVGDDKNPVKNKDNVKNKSNKQGRPLLRHGASGAAAGVGRQGPHNNNTVIPTVPAPVLVELASGKFKCCLQSCSRVYKTGCIHYLCKKCCDLHHRNSVLGSDYCEEGSDGAANMKNRQRFMELDSPNPCPAHRAKPKQVNKMKANLSVQMDKLQLGNNVEEEEDVPTVKVAADDTITPGATNSCALVGLPVTLHTSTEADVDMTNSNFSPTDATPALTLPLSATTTSISNTIPVTTPYQCYCKALLVGIGADEQMAGYGRHRTVYLKALREAQALQSHSDNHTNANLVPYTGSKVESSAAQEEVCVDTSNVNDVSMRDTDCETIATAALEAELNKDLHRLWKRNLGRDDRCISDNGREAWFPFLDERVVALLQSLSMDQICDLSQSQGVGDKRILRSAARQLGLTQCTELVKRAIQFGTRVAQHTNQHYHGSNRKGKGDTKIEE